MSYLLSVALFCGLLALLLLAASFVLVPAWENSPWKTLAETAHEVDVLVFGSSRTYCTVIPMEMWRHEGVTAVDVAGPSQPLPVTLSFMRQAFKTQDPVVVMVEVSAVGMDSDPWCDLPMAHRSFDNMPAGVERTTSILQSTPPTAWMELLLPLHAYHSRLPELTRNDLTLGKFGRFTYRRGADYWTVVTPQSGAVEIRSCPESAYLRDLETIREMAAECEDRGIRLVLYVSPSFRRVAVGGLPLLERIAADLRDDHPQVDLLDLNQVAESIGVDPARDYMDSVHLNIRGATKVSRWLGAHLVDSYGVQDRRRASFADRWDEDLRRYDAACPGIGD
jgi:hypothetical protein